MTRIRCAISVALMLALAGCKGRSGRQDTPTAPPSPSPTSESRRGTTGSPTPVHPDETPIDPETRAKIQAATANRQGYQAYLRKDYETARKKFELAIQLNDEHALAHYNLACVLALLRADGVCAHDAYKGEIVRLLQISVELDEARRERLRTDKDLAAVHDTFGFQVLAGLSPKRAADLPKLLERVSWYGPAPGAYGPMSGIDFERDGKLTVWFLDISGDAPRKRKTSGTWHTEGARVRVELAEPANGATQFSGTLDGEGTLDLGKLGTFTDDPSECDA